MIIDRPKNLQITGLLCGPSMFTGSGYGSKFDAILDEEIQVYKKTKDRNKIDFIGNMKMKRLAKLSGLHLIGCD